MGVWWKELSVIPGALKCDPQNRGFEYENAMKMATILGVIWGTPNVISEPPKLGKSRLNIQYIQ